MAESSPFFCPRPHFATMWFTNKRMGSNMYHECGYFAQENMWLWSLMQNNQCNMWSVNLRIFPRCDTLALQKCPIHEGIYWCILKQSKCTASRLSIYLFIFHPCECNASPLSIYFFTFHPCGIHSTAVQFYSSKVDDKLASHNSMITELAIKRVPQRLLISNSW